MVDNALYQALRALWEGTEPNYEEVLGTHGDIRTLRAMLASLWTRCYPEGKRVICIYSYRRIPRPGVPLLIDARGTVIAWDKDGPTLLAYPFHKFFNYGEVEVPNSRPLKAYEKVDGTMISVFWDGDKLRAATRKRLDTDSPFAQKALEMLKEFDASGYTYVFELLGPGSGSPWVSKDDEVQSILHGENWRLVPLARRDMRSLTLEPLNGPREFSVSSVEEALRIAEKESIEGLVLWYEIGKVRPSMVKVKSSGYARLMELLRLGYEGLARIILMNKLDDVARFLKPEVYNRAKLILQKLDEITKLVISGEFRDEAVREWLQVDPERAVEEAVKLCLKGGCEELLS